MILEIDDVRAWLIELGELESAALLSEAEFEYTYIDTAMRLDAEFSDTDIYELSIRVPGRIYRGLSERYKKQAEQIESAISELTAHTTGTWIRDTSWLLKMPKIEEVESKPATDEIFSDSSLHDVQRLWTKAKGRTIADPDGAVTASRTMLESLCKLLIDETEGEYTNNDDLPSLFRKVVDLLDLSPNSQTVQEYKKLSSACFTIVNAISCIRNRESDSHASKEIAQEIQAKFVVNLAGSISTFLIALRNEKKRTNNSGH